MNTSLLHQRNKQLKKIYTNIISSGSVNMKLMARATLLELIMETPAPRFYITPKMAERYVIGYKKQNPSILNSRKIDMIQDLVHSYEKVKEKHHRASMEMIWKYVVESPAKSFYISKRALKEVIFNYTGRYEYN